MVIARLLAVATVFLAGAALVVSLPDIVRYLRIRQM